MKATKQLAAALVCAVALATGAAIADPMPREEVEATARMLGTDAASLTRVLNTLEQKGVDDVTIVRSLFAFQREILELNKAGGGALRRGALRNATDPRMMDQFLTRLKNTHGLLERLDLVLVAGQNVYLNELKASHGDKMTARAKQQAFAAWFGIDAQIAALLPENEVKAAPAKTKGDGI